MLTYKALKALPRPQASSVSSSDLMASALQQKLLGTQDMDMQKLRYCHPPIALTDQSVMVGVEGAVEEDTGFQIDVEDTVSIRIALNGNFIFQLEGFSIEQYEGARIALLHFPGKNSFTSWYVQDWRYQFIHIVIPYRDLYELFDIDCDQLDESVRPFFSGDANHSLFQSFPLSEDFAELARDIINCKYEGMSQLIYLKAKGLEALCAVIEMFYEPPETSLSAKTREENQLILAKQIIKENFVTPPSLDDIASEIGMSRARLTRRFREKYDYSLMEYALQLRLNQSQQMLKSGRFSVVETAMEMGYKSASNFARSYQKYFGHSPKEDKGVPP